MLGENEDAKAEYRSQGRHDHAGFIGGHIRTAVGVLLQETLGNEDRIINPQPENQCGDDDVEGVEINVQYAHEPQRDQPAQEDGDVGDQRELQATEKEEDDHEDRNGRNEKEVVEFSSSEKQTVFESYVLTLFDPLFFKYERSFVRSESAAMSEIIELVFHSKTTDEVKFAVLPLFLEDAGDNTEWKLFDEETLQQNRRYSEENDVDLYYVVGHGGAPDDPHELFLLPAQLVKYEFVVPQALQPFRKTGMFFYNAAARKLQ